MTNLSPVCTIDGPSGSGKGTIASLIAEHYQWHLLDSGAIYRVVAKSVVDKNIDTNEVDLVVDCAEKLDLKFVVRSDYSVSVLLEGVDVSKEIRTEVVGNMASKVASIPAVREALVNRQRAFQAAPGLVADGRDMGTVIFPGADVKIFLSASAEERAERRYKQLKELGNDVNLSTLLKGIIERDERDSKRTVAPLIPAADALTIDTTGLSIDDVKSLVIAEIDSKLS